jgi:protease IV
MGAGLDTTITQWRTIRRKLTFWRIVAALLVAGLAVAAWQFAAGGTLEKASPHIARITISGVIQDDAELLERLDDIADDDQVKAMVVAISSPGGTTYGGEVIFKAIRKVAAKKPVVSDIRTLAASAGYMVAVAGDTIIAGDSSITGSIGVIFQYPQIKPLLDKIGVSLEEIKSAPMKAEPSPFHPPPENARQMINAMVMDSFDWFVGLVAERRGLDKSVVLTMADGSIYTGRQALKLGLIDQIGGEEEIRTYLAGKKLDKDLPMIDWEPDTGMGPFFVSGSMEPFVKLLGLDTLFSLNHLQNLTDGKLFLDGLVSVWQVGKS